MKLPFTFGFEMTGIYRHYREYKHDQDEFSRWTQTVGNMNIAISILIGNELHRIYPKSFKTDRYTDGHCIEFPSPVFTDTDEADRFYIILSDMMARYNYGPKHAVTVCGGNHIHFGLSEHEQIAQIVRFCYEHPWIVWVFTQPDDAESSDNVIKNLAPHVLFSDEKNYVNWYYRHTDHAFGGFEFSKQLAIVGNKHGNGSKTLEYRCVEAPLNLSEFQDQYKFFIALTQHALSLKPIKPIKNIRTKGKLQQITLRDAILGFEKLCIDLNIPSSRYGKYVKRNLIPRWEDDRFRN